MTEVNSNKKMLLVLNSENKWHRILRRGIVVGFWSCIAIIAKDQELLISVPLVWQPLATAALGAILVMAEKALREFQSE